jgi:HPr kinase/phosphorylase
MAFGAELVADDRVELWQEGEGIRARAPAALKGLIEARYLGILTAAPSAETAICAIVDLDVAEMDRLPVRRVQRFLDRDIPVFRRVESPHFPAALIQFLKSGVLDPDV